MRKLINIMIIAGLSALVFGGCVVKPLSIIEFDKGNKDEVFIAAFGDDSINDHTYFNNAIHSVMQQSALYTLSKGKSYFSISFPKEVANTKGSLINTMDELLDKCEQNMIELRFNLKTDKACQLHAKSSHGGIYLGAGEIGIIMYKEQPVEFLAYNANDVIKYLKEHEIYSDSETKLQYFKLESKNLYYNYIENENN